jgi:hypothetical protein
VFSQSSATEYSGVEHRFAASREGLKLRPDCSAHPPFGGSCMAPVCRTLFTSYNAGLTSVEALIAPALVFGLPIAALRVMWRRLRMADPMANRVPMNDFKNLPVES